MFNGQIFLGPFCVQSCPWFALCCMHIRAPHWTLFI